MKKIIKNIFHSFGLELMRYKPKRMGRKPYVDMSKILTSDAPILFDVGANIGQTVHEMNEMFSNHQIHSFEPSPNTFKVLRENTDNVENLNIWNLALGASEKTQTLNENNNSNMNSFLELGEEGWGKIYNKTPVQVTTVDKFCNKKDVNHIDVLKLDTQGSELDILKGSKNMISKNKISLLYFEVTFIEMYKELPSFSELYDYCINNNFQLVSIYPIHYMQNMAAYTNVLFKHKSYK